MAQEQRREREQITVPVDPDLRAAIKLAAERDHRTVASFVRDRLARVLESEGEGGERAVA
jgi:uncharacterized protein (DUF1778 family)